MRCALNIWSAGQKCYVWVFTEFLLKILLVLGCYAMSTGEQLPTFRGNAVMQSKQLTLLGPCNPEDEGTAFFEISIVIYQSTHTDTTESLRII